MFRTLRAIRFLFTGPVILAILFVISRMTYGGAEAGGWFRWAALGIGIVWLISLIRVLQAILVVGGLAALWAWLSRRGQNQQQQRPYQQQTWQYGPPPPPGSSPAPPPPHSAGAPQAPPAQTPPPPPWSGGQG